MPRSYLFTCWETATNELDVNQCVLDLAARETGGGDGGNLPALWYTQYHAQSCAPT